MKYDLRYLKKYGHGHQRNQPRFVERLNNLEFGMIIKKKNNKFKIKKKKISLRS